MEKKVKAVWPEMSFVRSKHDFSILSFYEFSYNEKKYSHPVMLNFANDYEVISDEVVDKLTAQYKRSFIQNFIGIGQVLPAYRPSMLVNHPNTALLSESGDPK